MKIKVGFAGARWLGVQCLKELHKYPEIQITHVGVPTKETQVWWTDVCDQDEVEKLGYEITPWREFKDLKFDILFSVLHGGIFKKTHLDNCKLGIINLHPAPLPQYRGCNSYSHAIMNGESQYGVTLHYVDEGIDTGDIINLYRLPIYETDTAKTLYDRAQIKAVELFQDEAPKIVSAALKKQKIKATKQNNNQANYYPRTSLENKEIDLNWGLIKIERFVRGLEFPPFDPAYFMINGKKINLTVAKNQIIKKALTD